MNNKKETRNKLDTPMPLWFILILPFYSLAFMVLVVIPISGDWGWFEGWAYAIAFAINTAISYAIINRKNPRALRNRMKLKKEGVTQSTRKSAASDWLIYPLMSIGFFGLIMLPGLAHRWGWPSISLPVEMAGLALANLGYAIINIAILQNSFASKMLDINQGQVLVDTGLYAHVRHPLYAGATLMMLATPIALGSWWSLIPAAIASGTLILRIRFEEDMLLNGMDGYAEYRTRVPYKIIPWIY